MQQLELPTYAKGRPYMDPNATLRMIDESLEDGHITDEVDDICEDLYDWLMRGGFSPSWDAYPLGTAYYRAWVALLPLKGIK